jgi:hypothetical protein
MKTALGPALLTVLLTSSAPALANGRFPESNHIFVFPHDPDLVLLRVTFGLLVSHDRGKTFDWVCEQAIGYSGAEDPMYAVTPSNTYMASTFQGISVSRNQACGWAFAGGELTSQVFIDLATNPKDAKDVVVFASSYDRQDDAGQVLFLSKIWETKDDAQTFTALGTKLDPSLLGYTIDLAASDPNRIYISAVRDPGASPTGYLLTSKDHGQTWNELTVPLEGAERSVYIAGVDPHDAERVYLRTFNSSDKPARLLLREASPDGGPATLRTLYTSIAPLLAFALSPDGSRVYIGGLRDGVKSANTTDFVFEDRASIEAQCLTATSDGLWACSTEKSGFIAGFSKDDGRTFEPRLDFCTIRGPLACPAETPTGSVCPPVWPAQRSFLGCSATGDAGAAGQTSPDAGAPGAPLSASGSGCSSQGSDARVGMWGAIVSFVGAAIVMLRRSRRRARP